MIFNTNREAFVTGNETRPFGDRPPGFGFAAAGRDFFASS
jgi:hypothetical protein